MAHEYDSGRLNLPFVGRTFAKYPAAVNATLATPLLLNFSVPYYTKND